MTVPKVLNELGQFERVSGPVGRVSVPVGSPQPWLLDAIPAGYVEFAGQAIPSGCPQLTALFGANMPDLRRLVMMGYDDTHAIGTSGGEAAHVLTLEESAPHQHAPNGSGGGFVSQGSGGAAGVTTGGNGYSLSITDLRGGGAPHNNLQPYRTVKWITAVA